ncbi:DUF7344 domain-containing protein [Natrinema salinisoli]|uniref:DUF7344 domain-containing protein n=1 Tax=Natrinema salinisoli TaxID=2878535 RepID=UPI001CEFCC37|nr:hypothetical protein [Natrinema salinisoli]
MGDWHIADGEVPDPIDTSFDVLSDPYRRSLCRYAMRTETDAVACEELVDYVVDRAPETAADDLDKQTTATKLRHVHLPKLDGAGMVEYDRRNGTVRVDRSTIAERLERVRAAVADLRDAKVDR